jgi:hypothetical protein
LEPDHEFINDFDGLTVASTHSSPWRYDTNVPVVFAGAELPSAKVDRAVTPYDIHSTLSAYLGVKSPSGAVGAVLPEVWRYLLNVSWSPTVCFSLSTADTSLSRCFTKGCATEKGARERP